MLPYQLHQKLRQAQARQSSSFSNNVCKLKGKPFWIWDKEEHRQQAQATNGNCCFNHVVSLPQKDKVQHPMYDYEKLLYDSLMSNDGSFKDKHLWVKKATGLGVTEFMLRIMAWLCTRYHEDATRNKSTDVHSDRAKYRNGYQTNKTFEEYF
jgi:hypothetical protein